LASLLCVGVASVAHGGFEGLPSDFNIVITYDNGASQWSLGDDPGAITDVQQNGDETTVVGAWTVEGGFEATWEISFDADPFVTS